MEIRGLSTSFQQPVYSGGSATSEKREAKGAEYQQTRLDVVDEVVLTGFGYDALPKQSRGAIDTYAMIGNLEQRDAIADVFGIDLYA